MLISPNYQFLYLGAGASGTSGTGAGYGNNGGRYKDINSPNAGIAGYGAYAFDVTGSSLGYVATQRGANISGKNWSKKIWMSGRAVIGLWSGSTVYDGDTNCTARISLGGKNSFAVGDISASSHGIGWKVSGGGASAVVLQVSNGTTVTSVTSSFTPTLRLTFDWKIYSDGAGNVTLYINDSQVATTTAGPTEPAANFGLYFEMADQTASATKGFLINTFGTKIYYAT
jgi:hypothetical protein